MEVILICRHCGSTQLVKRGTRHGQFKSVARYRCSDCGKYTSSQPIRTVSARILLLDIETAPGEYYSWSRDPQYLSPEKRIKDWSILCWGAKWLFEPEIFGETVKPKEAIERTEKSILGSIWKMMDEAQIIVTQNGIRFDIKRLNTKFIKYGYPPPSHYLNVDTLKVAKEIFDNTYNSLEEMGKDLLGLDEGKIKMNMGDWKQCVTGNQEYLDKMLAYCKNDVAPLLEDVYLVMRPWIRGHPNLNLFTNQDKDVCPACESDDLRWGEEYITPQGLWMGFRCNSCGALGRGTKKIHSIKKVFIKSN